MYISSLGTCENKTGFESAYINYADSKVYSSTSGTYSKSRSAISNDTFTRSTNTKDSATQTYKPLINPKYGAAAARRRASLAATAATTATTTPAATTPTVVTPAATTTETEAQTTTPAATTPTTTTPPAATTPAVVTTPAATTTTATAAATSTAASSSAESVTIGNTTLSKDPVTGNGIYTSTDGTSSKTDMPYEQALKAFEAANSPTAPQSHLHPGVTRTCNFNVNGKTTSIDLPADATVTSVSATGFTYSNPNDKTRSIVTYDADGKMTTKTVAADSKDDSVPFFPPVTHFFEGILIPYGSFVSIDFPYSLKAVNGGYTLVINQ